MFLNNSSQKPTYFCLILFTKSASIVMFKILWDEMVSQLVDLAPEYFDTETPYRFDAIKNKEINKCKN